MADPLPEVREHYALEVSSPGRTRPLTKPDHFRRFLGRRARVRLRDARDGHSSFTGELVGKERLGNATAAFNAGITQQIAPRVSVQVDYIRRSWGNLTATVNRAWTPADFDTFGPSARTLRAFISSYHDLLHQVTDALVPNPDVKPSA